MREAIIRIRAVDGRTGVQIQKDMRDLPRQRGIMIRRSSDLDGEQFLVQRRKDHRRVRSPELGQALHVQGTDFPEFGNIGEQDVEHSDVSFQCLMALDQLTPECAHHRVVQCNDHAVILESGSLCRESGSGSVPVFMTPYPD